MRALVTRPEEDAAPLAEALRARGIDPLIEPMLSVAAVTADAIDLAGVQAVLFSSANGVRAFAKRETRRDLPVYAVGDAAARAARAAGFADVKSAGRDAEALAKLVAQELKPGDGPLLHPRGRDTTGHLEAALRAAGFELRDPVVYRAEPAARLSDAVRTQLAEGAIDLALFFSPRTARAFVGAVENARLAASTPKVTAVCLSQAVADALAPLSFARTIVAPAPNQDALLAALPRTPRATAPRGRRWIWWLGGAVVLALVFAGLYLMRMPERATPTPQASVPLSAPVPAPASAPASAASQDDPRLAEVQRGLNALRAQVDAAPARLSALAAAQGERIQQLADRNAQLEQRVAALEERLQKGSIAGAEFLMATAVLRDAVSRGAPYAAPLDTLADVAKDDAEVQAAVAALRAGAASGVPTATMLIARFDGVADAIVRAERAPPGAGWWDRLWARISALVTVRRAGADAEGPSADAVAARAEAKVKAGDLAGAAAELDALHGLPADAARPWLDQAKARLAADAALDTLSSLALARLNKPE
jgi:uroporphyrinogen-III synthase